MSTVNLEGTMCNFDGLLWGNSSLCFTYCYNLKIKFTCKYAQKQVTINHEEEGQHPGYITELWALRTRTQTQSGLEKYVAHDFKPTPHWTRSRKLEFSQRLKDWYNFRGKGSGKWWIHEEEQGFLSKYRHVQQWAQVQNEGFIKKTNDLWSVTTRVSGHHGFKEHTSAGTSGSGGGASWLEIKGWG